MINLEWLRTFRAVYKTKSLSKASDLLAVSQPTVSQQISTLEAHLGQKLFTRKSKGVVETDEGKLLNTMVAGSLEVLEGVENDISNKSSKLNNILTIGISPHLYKTTLCNKVLELGPYVHIKFAEKEVLIRDVQDGVINYAIIPGELNTFDALNFPLYDQRMVLAATPDIDLMEIRDLYAKDKEQAERWLNQYKWYAHDAVSGYIKVFWMELFNKKRPSIIPNYIIPNEFEVLFQQGQGSGLSCALNTVVEPFVQNGKLNTIELQPIQFRKLSLIANKIKAPKQLTDALLDKLLAQRCYKM